MTDASAKQTPQTEGLSKQAEKFIAQGKYSTAKQLLDMAPEKTAPVLYHLGVIHDAQGDKQTAIGHFEQAIEIDPQYTPAYTKTAKILLNEGMALQALGCYGAALKTAPDDLDLKEQFLGIARAIKFSSFNPEIKALYLDCLHTPALDVSVMGASWFSLLKQDPVFKKTWKQLNKKNYKAFEKAFHKLADHKALLEPFFILGLQRQVRVPDIEYERLLTHLRRALLDNPEQLPELASALAHYCFHTEYIFDVTDEELQKVATLKDKAVNESNLSIIACYMPLHKLANATEIEKKFPSLPLVKSQITDHREQQDIIQSIESLTKTTGGVSTAVKAQYEEAPYPRWTNYAKTIHNEAIEGHLRGQSANILVAGCGTGHEAIELAHVFPDAQVLAIDLSFTSLAYGIKKAKEFGIKNITFKQADILQLDQLEQKFDYIASSGVLHHMENPEAGWNVVSGLLKPGGLFRLCLYSHLARQSLSRAQDIIKAKGYSSSTEDIRRFRQDAKKLLKGKDYKQITNYGDYYSLSECRDLLFHVQEHLFDIPAIQKWLDDANMDFLSFYLPDPVIDQYRKMFPQDIKATNLGNWHSFEQKHPDTFTGMYRIWAKK